MDFLNGKIKTLYFKYLAAAFGSALITSIYSIVDMAMVGQYHGPEGTAALAWAGIALFDEPLLRFFGAEGGTLTLATAGVLAGGIFKFPAAGPPPEIASQVPGDFCDGFFNVLY